MKTFDDLKLRVNELIDLANEIIIKKNGNIDVNEELQTLKHQSVSFIAKIYGNKHNMYEGIVSNFIPYRSLPINPECAVYCLGTLKAVKAEIEGGWLDTLKGDIMNEAFDSWMEMGQYFYKKGYHDMAAVMYGGVIEEHLRQLCKSKGIPIIKENNKYFRGAELNDKLKTEGVYTDTTKTLVTKVLTIRNHATHAEYDLYTKDEVKLMERDVIHFISANRI